MTTSDIKEYTAWNKRTYNSILFKIIYFIKQYYEKNYTKF